MADEERKGPGRPALPEEQRRRTFGISLAPATIARLQVAAHGAGLGQGEYLDRVFEGSIDPAESSALVPQWKCIPFQPDKSGELRSVGAAFVGEHLGKLVQRGWAVQRIFEPDQNGIMRVVLAYDPSSARLRIRMMDAPSHRSRSSQP